MQISGLTFGSAMTENAWLVPPTAIHLLWLQRLQSRRGVLGTLPKGVAQAIAARWETDDTTAWACKETVELHSTLKQCRDV